MGRPVLGGSYEAGPNVHGLRRTRSRAARPVGLFADANTFNHGRSAGSSPAGPARAGRSKSASEAALVGTFKRGDETSFPTPNLSVIGKPIPIPVGEFLLQGSRTDRVASGRSGRTMTTASSTTSSSRSERGAVRSFTPRVRCESRADRWTTMTRTRPSGPWTTR